MPDKPWQAGANAHVRQMGAVWADLDWKNFEGGREEVSQRLNAFGPAPSIVVCSGNGLHAYWLMAAPIAPVPARLLMQRIALVLGNDPLYDPARILRLPTSMHRKDPASPKPVEIKWFAPKLRYHESAFTALPKLPPVPFRPASPFRPPVGSIHHLSREARYARGALLRTCEALSSAADGNKHNLLFKAALSLGRFVGVGLLDAGEVSDWLLAAVERAGAKDLTGARKTIEDGFARGMREAPNIPNHQHQRTA